MMDKGACGPAVVCAETGRLLTFLAGVRYFRLPHLADECRTADRMRGIPTFRGYSAAKHDVQNEPVESVTKRSSRQKKFFGANDVPCES